MEFLKLNNAGELAKVLLRLTVGVVVLGVLVFLAVSQDWISVTKEAAVSASRVSALEETVKQQEQRMVTKETLDLRLAAIERNIDKLEKNQAEILTLTHQILLEQRRNQR